MKNLVELVTERGHVYGDPTENHSCTAALFEHWLERRYRGEYCNLDAIDTIAFNIMQKMSRLANSPHYVDSWRDVQGYAENALMVLDRIAEEK